MHPESEIDTDCAANSVLNHLLSVLLVGQAPNISTESFSMRVTALTKIATFVKQCLPCP